MWVIEITSGSFINSTVEGTIESFRLLTDVVVSIDKSSILVVHPITIPCVYAVPAASISLQKVTRSGRYVKENV